VAPGDASLLIESIALARPTTVSSTPSLWNKLYDMFQEELAQKNLTVPMEDFETRRDNFDATLEKFGDVLGNRVTTLVTGGAPTSPEVIVWMRKYEKLN